MLLDLDLVITRMDISFPNIRSMDLEVYLRMRHTPNNTFLVLFTLMKEKHGELVAMVCFLHQSDLDYHLFSIII